METTANYSELVNGAIAAYISFEKYWDLTLDACDCEDDESYLEYNEKSDEQINLLNELESLMNAEELQQFTQWKVEHTNYNPNL